MKKLNWKKSEMNTHTYHDNYGNSLEGKSEELWVTNRLLLEQADAVNHFPYLKSWDKVKQFEEVRDYFKDIEQDDLEPVYDRTGSGIAPIAFRDRAGIYYDVLYIRKSFELLPLSSFECRQCRIYFLGAPGAGKTVKLMNLYEMMKALEIQSEGRLNSELDLSFESKERRKILDKLAAFRSGILPDRNKIGEEIEGIPLRVNYRERSLLLEAYAEAGELYKDLNMMSKIWHNANAVTVFLFPADEYLEMAAGRSTQSVDILERYYHYGQRLGGASGRRFSFILTKADLLSGVDNKHLRTLLNKNTLKEEGGCTRLSESSLDFDIEAYQELQRELGAYIRESNPLLWALIQKIGKVQPVDLFICADLNDQTDDPDLGHQRQVPFRSDEFWRYILCREGILSGKKKGCEEVTEEGSRMPDSTADIGKMTLKKIGLFCHKFMGGEM